LPLQAWCEQAAGPQDIDSSPACKPCACVSKPQQQRGFRGQPTGEAEAKQCVLQGAEALCAAHGLTVENLPQPKNTDVAWFDRVLGSENVVLDRPVLDTMNQDATRRFSEPCFVCVCEASS
jgi:hypothetical protein